MTLTPEQEQSLVDETTVFATVKSSIADQITRTGARLVSESRRARTLTSEIHETRRVEDKALLASDEAVSHGLRDSKREELETLHKQLDNPYFARITLSEDQPSGTTKIIEYKLGFAANPDLRIIDWRKAPISKLYYEYKEGEEYLEEILGRERSGKVVLRNRIEVSEGELRTIQNRHGTFYWNAKSASWEAGAAGARKRKSSDAHLPEILSLITAEQFRSITVDAETAILIQGVAGSGKTTVALHRLAWLLHHENSPLKSDQCVFLMLSPALRRYVESSLPGVGISGIGVRTYHEWAARTIQKFGGGVAINRPLSPPAAGVNRVKRSLAILKALEVEARKNQISADAPFTAIQALLLRVLSNPKLILSNDESRLISEGLVREAFERTKHNFDNSLFDWSDDALLLRSCQLIRGGLVTESGSVGHYGHIVVDEVQDLSPVELSTIIGAVKSLKDLTLVGDTAQNIDQNGSFPGWERLRKHWNFGDEVSQYVSLEVSHRSTLPIMRLADFIQQRELVKTGRTGRTPIWFKTKNESQGIEYVIKWLSKAIELYPTMVTAVICATAQDAKFAFKMLQPTFGELVRLGDAYSFSFEEGILVTDVEQVKGLEFYSVLLWNPSIQSYPPTQTARNSLYVAATRAEENLCLVTWSRPAPMLPQFGVSKLVRSMDMTISSEDDSRNDGAGN